MASSLPRRLLFQISAAICFFSLLSSAAARPCRTFFISTYSFSLRLPPSNDLSNPNPNPYSQNTLTTFTHIRSFIPIYYDANDNILLDRPLPVEKNLEIKPKETVLGFSGYDFDSLRDRTKDILSVVVALLFGVGCGALTAATMYLVWSMFSNRYEFSSYDDYVVDDDDNDGGFESPKKMGYVKIPAADSVPAVAKEVV